MKIKAGVSKVAMPLGCEQVLYVTYRQRYNKVSYSLQQLAPGDFEVAATKECITRQGSAPSYYTLIPSRHGLAPSEVHLHPPTPQVGYLRVVYLMRKEV